MFKLLRPTTAFAFASVFVSLHHPIVVLNDPLFLFMSYCMRSGTQRTCHGMICYAMLYDAIRCHAMPWYAMRYRLILSAPQIPCIFYFLLLTSCPFFSTVPVNFGEDSRLLWSGSTDRTIRVWEIATGRCMGALNVATGGHTEAVSCLEYIPAIPQASAAVPGEFLSDNTSSIFLLCFLSYSFLPSYWRMFFCSFILLLFHLFFLLSSCSVFKSSAM